MKTRLLIYGLCLLSHKIWTQDTVECCKIFNKQLAEKSDFYKWKPSDFCTQYLSDSCIIWWKNLIESNGYTQYPNIEVIYLRSANKIELFKWNVPEEKFINSIRLIFSEYLQNTYVKFTLIYNDEFNGNLIIRKL